MSGGFEKMRRLHILRLIMRVRSELWSGRHKCGRPLEHLPMCLWIIADSLEQVGGGCFWVLTVHNPQEVMPLVRLWIVQHSFLIQSRGSLKPNVHYLFSLWRVKWGQSINMSYSLYLVYWKHHGHDMQSLWDSLAIKNHRSETYYSFG